MADQRKQHMFGGHDQQTSHYSSEAKSFLPQNGPTASQIIACVTLVPLGGTLLLLTGLILAGTFLGMALSVPLFVIFSPILVPAIVTVGMAVTGILTSGAFGITGLSSFSWLFNYLRRTRLPQHAIFGVQDTTDQFTQKARDMGQAVTDKAHEVSQAVTGKAQEVGHAVQGKTEEVGQNVKSKAHEAGHQAQETGRREARDVKVT